MGTQKEQCITMHNYHCVTDNFPHYDQTIYILCNWLRANGNYFHNYVAYPFSLYTHYIIIHCSAWTRITYVRTFTQLSHIHTQPPIW